MEGLHRRYLAEVGLRVERPNLGAVRNQLMRAARLVSPTDTRTHAQLELLRARVEWALGATVEAILYATAARDHFDKMLITRERDECERFLEELEALKRDSVVDLPAEAPPPVSPASRLLAAPRVFVTYAWESREYREQVAGLATRLRADGVDARLDRWHREGRTVVEFMNSEVRNADKILMLCSPQYRAKVHAHEDGAHSTGSGWEASLVSSQIFSDYTTRERLVLAVTIGTESTSVPTGLRGRDYLSLPLPNFDEETYRELVVRLRDLVAKAPELKAPVAVTLDLARSSDGDDKPTRGTR